MSSSAMTQLNFLADRGCNNKIYFPTQQQASNAAVKMAAKFNEYFTTYECRECGGLHVAHLDSTQQILLQQVQEQNRAPYGKTTLKKIRSKIRAILQAGGLSLSEIEAQLDTLC